MSIVSASRQFTIPEVAYLAWHVGWRPPALSIIVAIGIGESQLHSGTYRPESENPGGGIDVGFAQISSKWQPKLDPLDRFDPMTNLFDARAIWMRDSGFGAWGWPRASRNDQANHATAVEQIGDGDPYHISKSPYWAMREAGIDVHDLPVPPKGGYVSSLPMETLVYNDHGGANPTGPTHGTSINLLQLRLQDMGLYPYSRDQWYGDKTRAGVQELQRMLIKCRLLDGLPTGDYSRATRFAWNGALHFDHLRRGR